MNKFLIILVISIFLSSCDMASQYKRSMIPVPNNFLHPNNEDQKLKDQLNIALTWQSFFLSSNIQKVINQTLENNRDLHKAIHNIEAAKATYNISESKTLPNIDIQSNFTRERVPSIISSNGESYTSSLYNANFATAWEIDLFGRIKNSNKFALENYLATIEAHNATKISLIAETANAYLQILSNKKQLELTTQYLDNQQEIYDITNKAYQRGLISKIDLSIVECDLENVKNNYSNQMSVLEKSKNALMLLMGYPEGYILKDDESLDEIELMVHLPHNLSSEILLDRPDIMQAEHLLKAQNANIGAARAAFFPLISLTGSYGGVSNQLSNLFKGNSSTRTWNFMPIINLPIFDAGSNRANLKAANANYKIALANYEKSIQNAFREVMDTIIVQQALDSQIKSQIKIFNAIKLSYNLTRNRHKTGIDNRINFLNARQNLLKAEQSLVSIKQQQLSNLVNIFKALWVPSRDT